MSACIRGTRAGSQDKKDSSVLLALTLAGSVPTHNRQTLPHLGGPRGIVPRAESAGVGNHIKDLGLFRNLYTSDHRDHRAQRPSKAAGNFGTIDLAPCLSAWLSERVKCAPRTITALPTFRSVLPS